MTEDVSNAEAPITLRTIVHEELDACTTESDFPDVATGKDSHLTEKRYLALNEVLSALSGTEDRHLLSFEGEGKLTMSAAFEAIPPENIEKIRAAVRGILHTISWVK